MGLGRGGRERPCHSRVVGVDGELLLTTNMLKVRTRSEWILLVGGSAKIVGRVQLMRTLPLDYVLSTEKPVVTSSHACTTAAKLFNRTPSHAPSSPLRLPTLPLPRQHPLRPRNRHMPIRLARLRQPIRFSLRKVSQLNRLI